MSAVCLLLLLLAPAGYAATPDRFAPSNRLSGVGASRDDMSDDLLDTRTDLMIQSQTFAIMREPALHAESAGKRL